MEDKENCAYELLIEIVVKTTDELYELRQREINLLQRLLNAEKKISFLVGELAKEKFPKSEK